MSGLDLYAVQQNIKNYIQTQFPNYEVEEDGVPDDETLAHIAGSLKPYILLQWGSLAIKPGGQAVGGVRWNDYYSTLDVAVVSNDGNDARAALSFVVDRLIGYQPLGGDQMYPGGTTTTLVARNTNGVITAYLPTQRLRFGVNGSSVGVPLTA